MITSLYYILQGKQLYAAWQAKHLHAFDAKWLQLVEYGSKLCTIDLSQNKLENIPRHLLWELPGLENLNISKNMIRVLPGPSNADQVTNSV